MKALTVLALLSAAFLGACSSSQTRTASTTNHRNTERNTTERVPTYGLNTERSENRGTVVSNLDPAAQEWFLTTLPKTEHAELFGQMLGEWNTTMTWSMGPDAGSEVSTGTASNTATMQRFVQQEFKGEMLPGMVFQGLALFGYNAATGNYESVWCDNTSTAITTSTGSRQPDGSILWTGTFFDSHTGEQRSSKATLAFSGRDAMTYTVWDCDETGTEFASLRVDYSRDPNATAFHRSSATPVAGATER